MVTNVPGPSDPRYLGQVQLVTSMPVVPVTAGHQIAIGASSYGDTVQVGITADRDGVPDLDQLIAAIPAAVAELVAEFREPAP